MFLLIYNLYALDKRQLQLLAGIGTLGDIALSKENAEGSRAARTAASRAKEACSCIQNPRDASNRPSADLQHGDQIDSAMEKGTPFFKA